MRDSLRSLLTGLMLATCLVSCDRVTPNQSTVPNHGTQQTSFEQFQNQEAVPGEYILKRKGVSVLQTPEEFGQRYGLVFVKSIDNLGLELFQISDPVSFF